LNFENVVSDHHGDRFAMRTRGRKRRRGHEMEFQALLRIGTQNDATVHPCSEAKTP
jgi:hypothetical protein